MQKYTEITQTTSFKLPEITSYPILKNNELIPLNKTTFEFFRPKSRDANFLMGESGANFFKPNHQKGSQSHPIRPKTEAEPKGGRSKQFSQFKAGSGNAPKLENLESERITFNKLFNPNNENRADDENKPYVNREVLDEKEDENSANDDIIQFNNIDDNAQNVEVNIDYEKFNLENRIEPSKLLEQNIEKINRVASSYIINPNLHKSTYVSNNTKNKPNLTELVVNTLKSISEQQGSSIMPTALRHIDHSNSCLIKLRSFHLELKSIRNEFLRKKVELSIPLEYSPIIYSLDEISIALMLITCCTFSENFTKIEFNQENFVTFLEKGNLFNESSYQPFKHFNSFKFLWLTPVYTFEAIFRMPSVKVTLDKTRCSIIKIVDYDNLINMYDNKFNNWHANLADYLKSHKKYRESISKNNSKLVNKTTQIGEAIELDIDLPKFFNEKDKNYFFGLTDQSSISKFANFSSYQISCSVPKSSLDFGFNFKHFRMIEKFSNILSLDQFLKKLILVQDKEPFISLDMKYFDFIDENFVKYLKPSVEVKSPPQPNKDLIVKIRKPSLEFRSIISGNFVYREFEAPHEITDKFVMTDIVDWREIITAYKQEVVQMSERAISSKQSSTESTDLFNKSSTLNVKRKGTMKDLKTE